MLRRPREGVAGLEHAVEREVMGDEPQRIDLPRPNRLEKHRCRNGVNQPGGNRDPEIVPPCEPSGGDAASLFRRMRGFRRQGQQERRLAYGLDGVRNLRVQGEQFPFFQGDDLRVGADP